MIRRFLAVAWALLIPSAAQAQTEAIPRLYLEAQQSVVQVRAGFSHGTGFFVGSEPLVVTNEHVLSDTDTVSVLLPLAATKGKVRIPGVVQESDHAKDLALIRIDMSACPGCETLPLASSPPSPGSLVVALGFPLDQPLSITSGIVATVREGAIISDVNLNSGNSGGPLLNASGEVVGVNTFVGGRPVGGGISGSIPVEDLKSLLDQVDLGSPPVSKHLPIAPSDMYRLSSLKTVADSVDVDDYQEDLEAQSAGNFQIKVATPVTHFVAVKEYGRAVGEDRRERERRAGVPESEVFSAFEPYRDWTQYVGAPTKPLIAIQVRPKVGEGLGSVIVRGLTGSSKRKMGFDGDVGSVEIFRNGERVRSVLGGLRVTPVFIDNPLMELKDVVGEGYYAFRPEVVQPDSGGIPPSLVLKVGDLMHPGDSLKNRFELPPEVVARAWNDFAEYYGDEATRAIPSKFDSWCDEPKRWPDGWVILWGEETKDDIACTSLD